LILLLTCLLVNRCFWFFFSYLHFVSFFLGLALLFWAVIGPAHLGDVVSRRTSFLPNPANEFRFLLFFVSYNVSFSLFLSTFGATSKDLSRSSTCRSSPCHERFPWCTPSHRPSPAKFLVKNTVLFAYSPPANSAPVTVSGTDASGRAFFPCCSYQGFLRTGQGNTLRLDVIFRGTAQFLFF